MRKDRTGRIEWSLSGSWRTRAMVVRKLSLSVLLLLTVVAEPASAQLFGARTMRQPLTRRPRPGASTSSATTVGTLSGAERFLRSNRRRGDFVGADSRDVRSFVGAVQAQTSGRVTSPTTGLRVEIGETSSVNRPRGAPRQNGLYEPRLRLAFDLPRGSGEATRVPRAHRGAFQALERLGRIEVSVEGQTATLRGTVPSEHDRRLAALLVLFEPGIVSVRNLLQVATGVQPAERSKPERSSSRRQPPR
ncbi:MAG TPA: BON domain-containing protein [Planctomycetaceae bacterium]|nr:BON domain-containing protein [Planctomycetaceae bacterium]